MCSVFQQSHLRAHRIMSSDGYKLTRDADTPEMSGKCCEIAENASIILGRTKNHQNSGAASVWSETYDEKIVRIDLVLFSRGTFKKSAWKSTSSRENQTKKMPTSQLHLAP